MLGPPGAAEQVVSRVCTDSRQAAAEDLREPGVISGMLSVHGEHGQVWYHTWHGDFVQMIAGEE